MVFLTFNGYFSYSVYTRSCVYMVYVFYPSCTDVTEGDTKFILVKSSNHTTVQKDAITSVNGCTDVYVHV